MTFREAMDHYRNGTASAEERQFVEQELDKNRLITEYWDEQWDSSLAVNPTPAEEMNQIRKNLRRRNTLIVLTSLILAAALLLATIYVGFPAAERLYWDPTQCSYDTPHIVDLERTFAAYAELFCPDINVSSVSVSKSGFASYDIVIQYWNTYRGGDISFAGATVKKGILTLPLGFWDYCEMNVFDRATYPFYPASEDLQQSVYAKLCQLPEYITVVAAVSFPEDKSIAEVLAFQDALIDGQVGWTGIRNAPLDEQMWPLCGINLSQWGTVRTEANEFYSCLDILTEDKTPENFETHFKSLLRFSSDQAENVTHIFPARQNYYTEVLNYVEENGIYSYGCFVIGTPETILSLIENGTVSQVVIQDLWIGV